MKISVIIPCFNLGPYLEECITSVLNQTRKDFEVIVVDDGSNEEHTLEAIEKISPLVSKVIRTTNQGLVAARNLGISESTGEYICCLDADDIYHPDFLKKAAEILDNDVSKEIGFITTWVQEFEGKNSIWKTSGYSPIELMVNNVVHVASLFRKKCWEEVKGYQSNLAGYQDWNFWLSICGKGYKWSVIEECLFYYRIRANSMITSSDKRRYELVSTIIRNNLEMYQENLVELITALQKSNDQKQSYQDELLKEYLRLKELAYNQEMELKELAIFNQSIKRLFIHTLKLTIARVKSYFSITSR